MEATVSKAEYDAKKREIERLENENAMLRRALFGPRTERRSAIDIPEQMALWGEAVEGTTKPETEQAPRVTSVKSVSKNLRAVFVQSTK